MKTIVFMLREIVLAYSKEVYQKFLECIEISNSITKSARAAGISRANVYLRLKNNPEFLEAYNEAVDIYFDTLETEIRQDKSWQSNAWILERKRPNVYGQKITHSSEENIVLYYELDKLNESEKKE